MLENTVKTLPAQILVAAGFVTYLAKATEDMRADAIAEWEAITGLQKFDVLRLLSSESTMLTWKSEGLPADQLSMENALVILSSEHSVPFIVDPSTSATQWLKNHLGKIEPMLYPLVRRDLRLDGMRQVVRIGDKEVDYNEKFKLYLVSAMMWNPDPQLPPDAASLVNEVNFTVTKSGLEGQLLGVTLQHEQPELEQKKSELLAKEEDMKVQLAAVEKELLEVLATSEGNILENQALIDTLRKAKQKAGDIEASLEGAAKASEELDRQREAYRPFAAAGSRFFFLIR
ncbi:Dync2h1 [Symbiodinium sp. KB8]|nr:Dync2h1 [Symbiodinium sp. KB8]